MLRRSPRRVTNKVLGNVSGGSGLLSGLSLSCNKGNISKINNVQYKYFKLGLDPVPVP